MAIAAAGLLWCCIQILRLQTENDLLHQQVRLAELELRGKAVQLATAQVLHQAELHISTTSASSQLHLLRSHDDAPPPAIAVVLWQPDQRTGRLMFQNLPPLSDGSVYRLWVLSPNGASRYSVGAFTPAQATIQAQFAFELPLNSAAISTVMRFGISIEASDSQELNTHLFLSSG